MAIAEVKCEERLRDMREQLEALQISMEAEAARADAAEKREKVAESAAMGAIEGAHERCEPQAEPACEACAEDPDEHEAWLEACKKEPQRLL